MSPAYREEAAELAAQRLISQPFFANCQQIACYLPLKSEFATQALVDKLWQHHKTCYLPVVLNPEKSLAFVRYQHGDALARNEFGILEPVNKQVSIEPQALDLLIIPLIAFDHFGHRVGTGGGYYDRCFAFLKKQKHKKVIILGLGYAAQEADYIPVDTWDISLDAMMTEKGIIRFRGKYPL